MIAAGDHREALAACARQHGRTLGRLCMALLGAQHDADEAVQETLIAAHRAMASYRAEGSVRAWLCGIARHVCARQLETRRRARRPLELVPDAGDDPAGTFAARRRAGVVRAALDRLRPTEREALVMRFVADLSHREAAEAVGIDEATARKRVSRALDRLRAVLTPEEME
ncbi:MAG: RNA polymerase sigma factor [Kofleriaceae bacterium]|nr:RNA polymerase sigma factor [Kofleriaceae bacterium]MCB9571541.1 RNA polymerase sigma factor [Kofleriaceae bacterium]